MEGDWFLTTILAACVVLLLLILVSLQSILSALGGVQINQEGIGHGVAKDLDEIKKKLDEHRSALDDVRSSIDDSNIR